MPSNYKDIAPDPILTQFAVQAGTGGAFVADVVAPVVTMSAPAFKIPTFKQNKLDDEALQYVGPGDSANEVTRDKPTFVAAATHRYALKEKVTREIALAPGANPFASDQATIAGLTSKIRLAIEKRVKALLDAGGSGADPAVKWDAASGVAIEKNFDDHREVFLKATGFEANIAIVPPHIAKIMKRDATIRDLRKYTDPSLVVNGDLPANLWGLNILIPGALSNGANPGQAQNVGRLWSANTVYLLYVDPAFAGTGMTYTSLAQFRFGPWGTPFAADKYPDADKSVKVDWYTVECYQTEAVVASAAIRKITNVLT